MTRTVATNELSQVASGAKNLLPAVDDRRSWTAEGHTDNGKNAARFGLNPAEKEVVGDVYVRVCAQGSLGTSAFRLGVIKEKLLTESGCVRRGVDGEADSSWVIKNLIVISTLK